MIQDREVVLRRTIFSQKHCGELLPEELWQMNLYVDESRRGDPSQRVSWEDYWRKRGVSEIPPRIEGLKISSDSALAVLVESNLDDGPGPSKKRNISALEYNLEEGESSSKKRRV